MEPFLNAVDDDSPEISPPLSTDEMIETLLRAVAQLAVQVTITQIRLRALASETGEAGVVNSQAVDRRVRAIAEAETGRYLRENLGDALEGLIEVGQLESELRDYLTGQ
jgi:hypothetical protein